MGFNVITILVFVRLSLNRLILFNKLINGGLIIKLIELFMLRYVSMKQHRKPYTLLNIRTRVVIQV